MRTPWVHGLLLAALLGAGVGCGKKGPPIRDLPPPALPAGVAEPAAAPAPAPAEPAAAPAPAPAEPADDEFREGGAAP